MCSSLPQFDSLIGVQGLLFAIKMKPNLYLKLYVIYTRKYYVIFAEDLAAVDRSDKRTSARAFLSVFKDSQPLSTLHSAL